jgi:hypothetical protein
MRAFAAIAVVAVLAGGSAIAHDQHGNPNWITNGKFLSPIDGQHCCGVHDCLNEIVPFREVQASQDGRYWRCKKPDGTRRCFFAPPPGA